MRMGEIRALTPAQVHDDYIEVNAAWGEYDGRKSTKSGETREVPLVPEVRDLLKSLPTFGRPNKVIFSFNGEKPMDFQFISLRLHKVLEAVLPLLQAFLQHKTCSQRGERRAGKSNCRT